MRIYIFDSCMAVQVIQHTHILTHVIITFLNVNSRIIWELKGNVVVAGSLMDSLQHALMGGSSVFGIRWRETAWCCLFMCVCALLFTSCVSV